MADDLNALLQANRSSSVLEGIANPPQINPLAAITAGTQAASSMYDLRQKQAQEQIGNILQQSTDPATGRLDLLDAQRRAAAAGARVQMGMPGFVKDSASLQTSQFNLGSAERGAVNSAVTAALESDDANLKQSVLQQVERLRGIIPSDRLDATLLHLSSDPAQLRRQLETIRIGNLQPSEAQGAIYGTRQVITTPQGSYAPVLPPASKGGTPVIPHSLSPAELEGTVEVPDLRKTLPDGSSNPNFNATVPISRRELLTTMGYTFGPNGEIYPPGQQAPQQPGQPGAAAPGAAPTVNFGNGRRVPTPLVGPGGVQPPAGGQGANATTPAPVVAPAPVVPPATAPRPVMVPSPGDTKLATDAGPLFNTEITNANAVPARKAILANMLADSRRFSGGTGADFQKEWKRLLLTWSPYLTKAYTNITKDSVEAQESFDKLAAQILQQQQSGAGSDFRMGINVAATPSSGLTPQGRELIMAQLAGNEDYLAARAKLANQWPAKSDFAGYQQHVKQLDPRVFQYENMDREQGTRWLSSLPRATQEEIIKAHNWATSQGLIGAGR